MTIKFGTITRYEVDTIHKIADRALQFGKRSKMDWAMDITACHCNGNPLRLDELLASDDFNFTHDVLGISRHLNRDTGKLSDFSPRFSQQTDSCAA